MRHVMLDLETWGLRPGSAIRAVGGAVFDLETGSAIGPTFYANVTRGSCEAAGLLVDPGTEKFWATKKDNSAEVLAKNPMGLNLVVAQFHDFCREYIVTQVWAQSLLFDLPIWLAAAEAVKLAPPWKHFNQRDAQTALALNNTFDVRHMPLRPPGYKTAEDNAVFQVKCLRIALGLDSLAERSPAKPLSDLFG